MKKIILSLLILSTLSIIGCDSKNITDSSSQNVRLLKSVSDIDSNNIDELKEESISVIGVTSSLDDSDESISYMTIFLKSNVKVDSEEVYAILYAIHDDTLKAMNIQDMGYKSNSDIKHEDFQNKANVVKLQDAYDKEIPLGYMIDWSEYDSYKFVIKNTDGEEIFSKDINKDDIMYLHDCGSDCELEEK